MKSRAEHARRTIAKLEARLEQIADAQDRRRLEAQIAFWRRYLAKNSGDPADELQQRERGS